MNASKRIIIPIVIAIVGMIVLGSAGFASFVSYGGNSCDMPGKGCDCFCCNMFGLRGYEACGDFGFLAGASVGAISGLFAYSVYKKRYGKSDG